MEQDMKENEKMICNKDLASRNGLMDLDMKGNMKTGKKMEKVSLIIFQFEKESIFGVMDQNTKVNERITRFVDKFSHYYINFDRELMFGQMNANTLVLEPTIICNFLINYYCI